MANWKKILQDLKAGKTKTSSDYPELSIDEKELIDELLKNHMINDSIKLIDSNDVDHTWNVIKHKLPANKDLSQSKKPYHFAKVLLKYAAILAIPLLVASVLLYINKSHYFSQPISQYTSVEKDHNKAILVLADGSMVELDKAGENVDFSFKIGVNKTIDFSNTPPPSKSQYNTLIVPKGSEYHLLLSDGSKVHLNSDSRIKFPIHFDGQALREIFLEKGEAFFEVATNKDHPFVVNVQGLNVTVLGTSFNINSYSNTIATTLVEGKLRVSSKKNSVIIHPNQQAISNTSNDLLQVNEVDVSSYIGWHNNQWVFDGDSLDDIMTSLTNWYDYEVIFVDKTIGNLQFAANLHRYSKIEEVLSLLEKTEKISFTIKGKRIYVHKKPTHELR